MKKHPWRNYENQIFANKPRPVVRGKMLPEDVAHIIDIYGYRHSIEQDGAYGLFKTDV